MKAQVTVIGVSQSSNGVLPESTRVTVIGVSQSSNGVLPISYLADVAFFQPTKQQEITSVTKLSHTCNLADSIDLHPELVFVTHYMYTVSWRPRMVNIPPLQARNTTLKNHFGPYQTCLHSV